MAGQPVSSRGTFHELARQPVTDERNASGCSDAVGAAASLAPYETPNHAILLNCFGRGGSSIVWNMIGSSPDVLLPSSEWHQGFYGRWHVLSRLLRRLDRSLHLEVPAMRPLCRRVYRRACASVPEQERTAKPDASSVVLKVMDYHMAMNPTIAASFETVSQVVLVRHPLPQCESLLRTGLDLDRATTWYVDVTRRMIELAGSPDTIVCRFDDVVCDPFAQRDLIYRQLALSNPHPDGFKMKRKKFGHERTPDVKHATGDYVDVTARNVADLIDKDVNERSVERLSARDKASIWKATADTASYFGYKP